MCEVILSIWNTNSLHLTIIVIIIISKGHQLWAEFYSSILGVMLDSLQDPSRKYTYIQVLN